jgi:septal ring factor EnvC (AmiA/AmiB activator)
MKRMVEEVAQTEKELEKSAPQSEESIEAMKAQLVEMEEQNHVIESKIDEM